MATALQNPPNYQATPPPASRNVMTSTELERARATGADSAPLPGPSPLRVFLNVLATAAILAVLLLLQGCNRGESAGAKAEGSVAQAPQPQNTDAIPPTPAPVTFAVDQVVAAGAVIDVVADASTAAPVLEIYDAGALFSVLEPGLDRGAYPIIADGISWVRVRAGDGLAGWVNAGWLTH